MRMWLFILSLLAACGVAAWFLAPLLAVSQRVALLITMCVMYGLLSAGVELYRARLRKRVEKMPPDRRALLSSLDPEIRYAIPAPGSASPRVTTLIGALAINGPVLPLMLGPLALLSYVFEVHDPLALGLSFALGFCLAWVWWSASVTVWRWWATARRGMPPGEAQWRGEQASFLWPRHHLFEKTELGQLLARRRAR